MISLRNLFAGNLSLSRKMAEYFYEIRHSFLNILSNLSFIIMSIQAVLSQYS